MPGTPYRWNANTRKKPTAEAGVAHVIFGGVSVGAGRGAGAAGGIIKHLNAAEDHVYWTGKWLKIVQLGS